MNRIEIKLAGFGGQGIVLLGYIIGKGATIFDKKYATLTQVYGPEARGGATSTQIIISDQIIDYPHLIEPQIMICMSQEAFTKFHKELGKNGKLILDKDLVKYNLKELKDYKVYEVPATKLAEKIGKKFIANIVMAGAFTFITKVVTYESMKKSILSSVPAGTEKLNEQAFNTGYEYGKENFLL